MSMRPSANKIPATLPLFDRTGYVQFFCALCTQAEMCCDACMTLFRSISIDGCCSFSSAF